MNPITIPVSELKPALIGLGKITGKRQTLPVLGCVHIERTREGRIELTATDLDRSATVVVDRPDQGAATKILVPLEDLSNLAKSCSQNDTLVIAGGDNGKATIRFPVAGNILEHQSDSLPVNEFPQLEEVRGTSVAIDSSVRQAVHDAISCASTDQTRMILNGACLDVSKADAHYVVGTDGRHLFSANSFKLLLTESLIVPTHPFLAWKGFNEDGDWQLRVKAATKEKPQILELATTHWRYVCRSYDGNYPNWRQVVPAGRDFCGSIEIAADALENIIRTITRLPDHDDRFHAIGLEIEAGKARVLAKANAEQPWTHIELPAATASGTNIRTYLNRYLMLKALKLRLTRIDLIDALAPIRFCDAKRQMIVMPVRADAIPAPAPTQPTPEAPPAITTNPPPISAEPAKEEIPVSEKTNNGSNPMSPAAETTSPTEKPALETALAQLELVRGEFRGAMASLNKLGEHLKQVQRENKASEKEIQSVRATLRQLQAVRI